MGVDGGDYSLRGKRSVGFGGDVCLAGFLCETARGDFRFGDSIENGARQSRASLRALARTRAAAKCSLPPTTTPEDSISHQSTTGEGSRSVRAEVWRRDRDGKWQ